MNYLEKTNIAKAAILCVLIAVMASCDTKQSEFLALQKEVDSLRRENDELKAKVEDLSTAPDILLPQGMAKLKDNNYEEAREILNKIIVRRPSSPEAKKSQELIANLDEKIKAEALAAEKAESQRITKATVSMKTTVDQVEGITWYKDKKTSEYVGEEGFYLFWLSTILK